MRNVQISNMLEKMPLKKVDSGNFNDYFQIDGIPLWYFLRSLMSSAFLPKPFKPQFEIERQIKKTGPPSLTDRLRFNLYAFVVKKGLILHEGIKYLISKYNKKDMKKTAEKDVLFTILTNQISEKNKRLEFLGSGKIINVLEQDKKVRPLVLVGDPFSKNSFFRLNRYGPLIYDYITPAIIKESKQLAKDLHRKWKILDKKFKIKLFTWGGKSYWNFFENDMDFLFSEEVLYTLIKYYLTFKDILKKHGIKVVYITGFSDLYELSALGAAYKLDRKVVYSSHGYARGAPGKWEFIKNVFFAEGAEEHKKDLLGAGIKKENIALTGFPFLDETINYRREKTPSAKKTVTLITTAMVEKKLMEKEKYFGLIREVLTQINNVEEIEKTIIKIYPLEKHRSNYESIVQSLNMKNVEIVQDAPKATLYSIINSSDLLLGFVSVVLIEGLILDKDVIHLDSFPEKPEIYKFRKGMLCAKRSDNLTELIKRVLNDKNLKKKLRKKRETYLRESFYKLDGKAHQRIADLIERIASKST